MAYFAHSFQIQRLSPAAAADVENGGAFAQRAGELLQRVGVHVRSGNGDAESDALRRIHVRTHFAIVFTIRLFHGLEDIVTFDDAVGAQIGDQSRVRVARRLPRHLLASWSFGRLLSLFVYFRSQNVMA